MATDLEVIQVSATSNKVSKVKDFFGLNKPAKTWWVDNHLLVFLFVAFVLGLVAPEPGRVISKPTLHLGHSLGSMRLVQFINVVIIFFISGLRLKTDAVVKALKQPAALLFGWLSILVLTPSMGFLTVRLPFEPKEFAFGLTLFCCVPTTLTSGAALVSGCKGANRATELALMTTVSTNLLGCFTTPVFLSAVLSGLDVAINVANLLTKLVLSLLLPTVIGKIVQVAIPAAAKFAKDWKITLTIFSNFNLVCIVWQSVSRAQETITTAGGVSLLACIASGIILHLLFWILNYPVYLMPKITDMHQRRAVFLLGSQKTLPVCLAIIAGLPDGVVGNTGLMALPCIFGHLSQLVIDAFLVDHWAKLSAVDTAHEANTPRKEGKPSPEGEIESNEAGCADGKKENESAAP